MMKWQKELWRRKQIACKGVCVRYKAQKPSVGGRYEAGQKRCQICEEFIWWEGLWCPCCSYRLRAKPRNIVYKTKLREAIEAEKKLKARKVEAE